MRVIIVMPVTAAIIPNVTVIWAWWEKDELRLAPEVTVTKETSLLVRRRAREHLKKIGIPVSKAVGGSAATGVTTLLGELKATKKVSVIDTSKPRIRCHGSYR